LPPFVGITTAKKREILMGGGENKTKNVLARFLEPKVALSVVTAVALAVRLLPMRFRYLLGYDPYFHLAYIEYALKHGWVNFFPYAFGPWGMQIKLFHPLGLWMTPAYVYKLLHPLGVSVFNAFRITPVIFGVLTVVLTYLAVLRLYGKREAFLASFILAVSFGHVFRSMAGYYRGDNYMLFWYGVALLGISLGLTWRPRRWRYERFAFYAVPGIAAGLSAIFWQAYYPIFAFVLANAVLLSVGAFILEKDETILDGAAIAISTVLGALMANALGGIFNYGMVGYDRGVGRNLAKKLGLHFGFIKDAFLLAYLKYAVPAALVAIVVLLVVGRKVRGRNRLWVVGAGAAIAALIGLRYYGTAASLIKGIFVNAPIIETQRTGLHDLWEAYGLSFLAAPAFLLGFRRKRLGDYVILGLAFVSVPMLLIWTRFLFIGSLAVAVMAGVGLAELANLVKGREAKGAALAVTAIVLLVPAVTAIEGVKTTWDVEPFMNPHWEAALEYIGNHSAINDVVITWWNYGHWVTYYAHRAPVAQGGPSWTVARYYLGLLPNRTLMGLGVDYVIVSLPTALQFPSILDTAGIKGWDGYFIVPLWLHGGLGGTMVFSGEGYSVVLARSGNAISVSVQTPKGPVTPAELIIEAGRSIKRVGKGGNGLYVYVNLNYGYAFIMNEKAFRTTLAQLLFNGGMKGYHLVYSDGGYIKVYRFLHPNVVVTAENGSIVLRFENATGTGLGIWGYLDNGTLVFRKWYGVKGRNEFVLPKNLNGSVVVRYAYAEGKVIVDRGVFRIEDVLEGGWR